MYGYTQGKEHFPVLHSLLQTKVSHLTGLTADLTRYGIHCKKSKQNLKAPSLHKSLNIEKTRRCCSCTLLSALVKTKAEQRPARTMKVLAIQITWNLTDLSMQKKKKFTARLFHKINWWLPAFLSALFPYVAHGILWNNQVMWYVHVTLLGKTNVRNKTWTPLRYLPYLLLSLHWRLRIFRPLLFLLNVITELGMVSIYLSGIYELLFGRHLLISYLN